MRLPTTALQSCVDACTAPCERSELRSMRSLLSVASLFGRLPHSFKALLKLSGDILQDDLDKTIVAYALGAARPRGRAPRTEGRAGDHSPQRNHSRVTLEPNSPPSEVWAWSILKAERPGFEGRAQTKPKSGTRKSKAAATKSNPAQRNPNCFSFPESRLSTGYRRFRCAFASYIMTFAQRVRLIRNLPRERPMIGFQK